MNFTDLATNDFAGFTVTVCDSFDRLGCFTYSHEEDTHAYTMEDDVPDGVKQQRASEIMELQGGISYELNQQKVGKVFKVLVDKAEGGRYYARTEHDSPEVDNDVLIPTSAPRPNSPPSANLVLAFTSTVEESTILRNSMALV